MLQRKWKNFWKYREMEAFYSQFIHKGDVCFDIGANMGSRTKVFLRLGAKVISMEPQADCVSRLKKKFGKKEAAVIVQAGLGAKPGKAALQICDRHPLSTFSIDQQTFLDQKTSIELNWTKGPEIDILTLDQLIQKHGLPRFCKIDVEGMELAVLQGLSQAIPALSFEFLMMLPDAVDHCLDRLKELGEYEYNYTEMEYMNWVLDHWVDSDSMKAHLKDLPESMTGDIYARLVHKKG